MLRREDGQTNTRVGLDLDPFFPSFHILINSPSMSSTPGFIDIGALRNKYQAAGQDHLFAFWDDLSPEEQGNFAKQ